MPLLTGWTKMVKRQNGEQEALNHAVVSTARGWVAVLTSSKGIRRMSLPHDSPSDALGSLELSGADAGEELAPESLDGLRQRLDLYFNGGKTFFPDALDLKGTDFQKRAWEAARAIPWGETRSYRWIAVQMGRPGAARAVGQAMRANPAPIVVPCHRVIGENGELRGYGGPDGIGMKQDLLAIERGSSTSEAAGKGG